MYVVVRSRTDEISPHDTRTRENLLAKSFFSPSSSEDGAQSPLGGRKEINSFSDRRPQSRRDYPLNLSILLSGGKETNQDFPSSGERTGKSPAPNPAVPPQGNVVFGRIR